MPFLSKHSFFYCIFLFLLLFSTSILPQEKEVDLSETFASLEKKIVYVKLKNGLRVILMNKGIAPVTSAYIKFKAGSYDENSNAYGIAHMLEHMLFKGTYKVGTCNFAKEENYLELSHYFAQNLDQWRLEEEKARAREEPSRLDKATKEVKKWQTRLQSINQEHKNFIHPEEDSHIYAIQGARGYNAYTSSDLTNYQVNLPSNRLEVWARLEADRLENSVLREFYTERDVVTEERRMRIDNSPRSQLWEKFRSTIYEGHPYGHPVIGPMRSIQYLNHKQARKFYETYYAPNNTVISLVGNFEVKSTISLIKKYFGKLKPKPLLEEEVPPIPKFKKVDIRMKKGKTKRLYLAWFKPPMPDPNDIYLELLAGILGGSPETRLYHRLVTQEKLAVHVSVSNGAIGNRATDLFMIRIQANKEASLDRIQEVVMEEIRKIRREGPKKEELKLVSNRLRMQLLRYLQKNAGFADLLSYYELITGDYKYLFRYNTLLDQVSSKKVKQASLRYLYPSRVMTARLLPEE